MKRIISENKSSITHLLVRHSFILIMIETLRKMDMVMPLEIWGIVIGLVTGMILWIGFLMFIDWLSDRR